MGKRVSNYMENYNDLKHDILKTCFQCFKLQNNIEIWVLINKNILINRKIDV